MNLDLVVIFVTIACTPLTISIGPTSTRLKALQGCVKGVGIRRRCRDTPGVFGYVGGFRGAQGRPDGLSKRSYDFDSFYNR